MNDTLIDKIPDFNDPLGVLRACHERMLNYCDILEKLVPHIADQGFDEEARAAIRRLTRYFSTSVVHHHHDEEEDLFPVINRQSLKLADVVHRARKEHVQLTELWKQLAIDLKKGDALTQDAEFPGHVEAFCNLYRQHIAFENSELLDLARHILSSRQLENMGKAMARRRGVHHGL